MPFTKIFVPNYLYQIKTFCISTYYTYCTVAGCYCNYYSVTPRISEEKKTLNTSGKLNLKKDAR